MSLCSRPNAGGSSFRTDSKSWNKRLVQGRRCAAVFCLEKIDDRGCVPRVEYATSRVKQTKLNLRTVCTPAAAHIFCLHILAQLPAAEHLRPVSKRIKNLQKLAERCADSEEAVHGRCHNEHSGDG
jgi:hypothetical protein